MTRQLYLVGTVHTDPDGPRRLSRAYKTLDKPKQITVEAKDGAEYSWFTQAEAHVFSSLCEGLPFTLSGKNYLFEANRIAQFEEFKGFYGYELMVAQALHERGLAEIHLVDTDPNVPDGQRPSLVHRLEQVPYELRRVPGRAKQFLYSKIRPYVADVDVLVGEFDAMCESGDLSSRAFDIEQAIYEHLVEKLFQEHLSALFGEQEVRLSRIREFAVYAALTFFSVRERSLIVEHNYYQNDDPSYSRGNLNERTIIRDKHMEQRIRDIMATTQSDVLHIGGAYHMFGEYHNLFERLRDLKPKRYRLTEFNIDDWDTKLAKAGK